MRGAQIRHPLHTLKADHTKHGVKGRGAHDIARNIGEEVDRGISDDIEDDASGFDESEQLAIGNFLITNTTVSHIHSWSY
jgi:hypothetical protein